MGVRAEFAEAADQASAQFAAYNTDIYLDASSKTGALFQEKDAIGRQRYETVSVTGVSELSPTDEAQPFVEANYVPSFITSVEPYKFTKRIVVTQEAAERRDSKYAMAMSEVTKLNVAGENTKAHHRFGKLNHSFASATALSEFDYGDGVALVSDAHPTQVAGVTQSNLATPSDITNSTIETMVLVLRNQTDDIGEPMPCQNPIGHIKPSLIYGEVPEEDNAQEARAPATTKREGWIESICNSLNTSYNLMKLVSETRRGFAVH